MNFWARRAVTTASGLTLAVGMLIFVGGAILLQTVAPNNGQTFLIDISDRIDIVFDESGIPHVEAKTAEDAAFALGWLHASERMWQMDILRRAASGRLSELLGEGAVASDVFLRTIGIEEPSRSSFRALREDTRAYLEAYAKGVNAWLERTTRPLEPRLPIEYILTGSSAEPWEAWQSIAIVKVMALTLDSNMDEEIARLTLAARGFSSAEISDLYPSGPRDLPPELPDLRALFEFGVLEGAARNGADPESTASLAAEAPWALQMPASNNWAIAGARTRTGAALLANDPHLNLTAPSMFFLVHLSIGPEKETRNVWGGTLPGVPLVLSGRNDRVAWGLTTTSLDSQDLFLEKVNPTNTEQYLTENGYRDFEIESFVIGVRNGQDVPLTVRRSRNGVVLPGAYKKIEDRFPSGYVAALAWTALADDDTTIEAFLDASGTKSAVDFSDRLRAAVSPMQSVAIADNSGRVEVIAAGRVPLRSKENIVAGRAPVPGWIETYRWQGYLDPTALPHIADPEAHAVATANADWLPTDYPHHITFDWAEPFRQQRVEALYLDNRSLLDFDDMVQGQADRLSPAYLRFRDQAFREMPQGIRADEEVSLILQRWDGQMDAASPAPSILVSWHRQFERLLLEDDLGSDFDLVSKGSLWRVFSLLNSTGARNWCDRQDTTATETCGKLFADALERAVDELRATQGGDITAWRWGEVHRTFHEHRPFSRVGALSSFFSIREEMGGGTYTLLRNSTDFSKDFPYFGRHGSAMRAVHDLGDRDGSLFVVSTGQSGNVFSSNYKDQTALWAKQEYIKLAVDPSIYRTEAIGTLTLNPAN